MNKDFDIAVVGSGAAGIAAAELIQSGRQAGQPTRKLNARVRVHDGGLVGDLPATTLPGERFA